MGDGPYADSSAAGSSWPWGHPGHLPAQDYPASHSEPYSGSYEGGGASAMLDHFMTDDQDGPFTTALRAEVGRWWEEAQDEAFRLIHDGPIPPARRCTMPDCTIPSASDDRPCEAHQ